MKQTEYRHDPSVYLIDECTELTTPLPSTPQHPPSHPSILSTITRLEWKKLLKSKKKLKRNKRWNKLKWEAARNNTPTILRIRRIYCFYTVEKPSKAIFVCTTARITRSKDELQYIFIYMQIKSI